MNIKPLADRVLIKPAAAEASSRADSTAAYFTFFLITAIVLSKQISSQLHFTI